MFRFLSRPATPWVTVGVLLVVTIVGFFVLRSAWRAEGAAAAEVAAVKAVEEQRAKDAALSAQLVDQLQSQIKALEANAAPVREEIKYVPVTRGCGPAVNRAADWMRNALGAGGSPTRP